MGNGDALQQEKNALCEQRRLPRPIIFLDMDNVLCVHPEYHSGHMLKIISRQAPDWPELFANIVDAGAAANLRQLHQEFRPHYVISSSWATHLDRIAISTVLRRLNLEFVVENLLDAWQTPRALRSGRRDEIESWLANHRTDGQPFIILDDVESGYTLAHSHLDIEEHHVVLCEQKNGFCAEKLAEARWKLQRQLTPEEFSAADDSPALNELRALEVQLCRALDAAKPVLGLSANAQFERFAGPALSQFGAIVRDEGNHYVAWFSTDFVLQSVEPFIDSANADAEFWRDVFK